MDDIGWIGIFVALLGAGLLLWGLLRRSKANALVRTAQQWPTASGTVMHTDIVTRGTARNPIFDPVVRYEYEVGGRKYFGDRLRPGYVGVGSVAAAQRMLQPYQAGASVAVRYDPADPESSLLELNTSSVTLIAAIVGGILLVVGIGIAIAAMMHLFSGKSDRSSRSRDDSRYERSRDEDRDEDRDDRRSRRDRDEDEPDSAASSDAVTPGYLAGRWCGRGGSMTIGSSSLEIQRPGQQTLIFNYTLTGDQLDMTEVVSGARRSATVSRVDYSNMRVSTAGAGSETLRRC